MLLNSLVSLGQEFDGLWKSVSRDTIFSNAAHAFLSNARIPKFRWDEIERLSIRNGNYSHFGDLNFNVFQTDDFRLEVLVWGSSSPDIHSHGFSGAFRVLTGGSVHAVYEVENERQAWSNLAVGKIRLSDLSILEPGDTHQIVPGLDFVHGLYHWGFPSVTIVLRTIMDSDLNHQFVCPDPSADRAVFFSGRGFTNDGQLRAFRSLVALRPWAEIERVFTEALEDLEVWQVWSIYSEFSEKFGERASKAIRSALPYPLSNLSPPQSRRSLLRTARALLNTDRARIAAGLLMFAPSLSRIIEVVKSTIPTECPSTWFENAAIEAFQSILADIDQDGLASWIVPDVLNQRDVHHTVATLARSFGREWDASREHTAKAIYNIVANEVGYLR
ncbi:cupin domain-containing protein [Henriciella marina]|uniref:hypothetical protein n=1 Tax=Henriciella marina TaxID=453851 RepID=UPI0003A830F4|nr:hypothetical protein [Henriciella marina]